MATTKKDSEQSYPGILYAEPAALGILANVMSAIIVAISNITMDQMTPTSQLTSGVHLLVIGGLLQLLSGLMSFRRNDHFTASALVFLASLWGMYGINMIIYQYVDSTKLDRATFAALIGYCVGLLILSLCALTVNYIMPPLLISALLALVFEAVGMCHIWGRRVAIGFELMIGITGSYAVLVIVLKGISQRYVLPGFGNAPYNVLLIKAKGQQSQQTEEKRNTKYAEPYAMGYLGNIVPSVSFAFYYLGYFDDFTLALPCLLSAIFCHLFTCYYCFLRNDTFHAVQYMIYAVFWLSRAISDISVAVSISSDIDISHENSYALIGLCFCALVLLVPSLCQSTMVLVNNAVFFLLTVLSLVAIPGHVARFTFGLTSVAFAAISVYTTFASLINTIAEKTIVYIGSGVVSRDGLRAFFYTATFRQTAMNDVANTKEDVASWIVDSLSFFGTTVAAVSLCGAFASTPVNRNIMSAAVVVISGVIVQTFAMRLAFVTRTIAKCYSHVIAAAAWMAWAAVLYKEKLSPALRSTSIGLTCLHVTIVCLSILFTRLWIPFAILNQISIILLMLHCYGVTPEHVVPVFMGLLAATSLYSAAATLVNGTLKAKVLPVGDPILKPRATEEEVSEPPCPVYTSKLTSGVREIATIMNAGGVCGIPTDTVYALSASCRYPRSIVKIFEIKGRSREKPMCLCLAYLDQLREVNPDFSPLLWAFMRRCYPGGISCVVPKGPWLERLGISHASQYIGTPDSVCIRVPDSTPLAHLISMTGPVVLTSANPSGAVDSTHHDMVVDRLGSMLDGVLCDGYSRELVASTVVNCLHIDEGVISYFRVGCYPKEKVDAIFAEVLAASRVV